ncbi:hypothetical protein JCM15764A_17670 [Geotalea toluenoxydans]
MVFYPLQLLGGYPGQLFGRFTIPGRLLEAAIYHGIVHAIISSVVDVRSLTGGMSMI